MAHPYLEGLAGPRIFAHRGYVTPALAAAGIAENTRAAFTGAVDAGVDYVESDCHLTSDGRVVLFHDTSLSRITGEQRLVADTSCAELAERMRGRGGLLTLDEALEGYPDTRFNIDVKAAAAAERAGRIVAPHAHRVLLTSFDDANRRRALAAAWEALGPSTAQPVEGRAAAPAVLPATSPGKRRLIAVLGAVASGSRTLMDRAFAGLDALQVPERQGRIKILTHRLVEQAHRRGVEVHVWTVNDPQRMIELVDLGADGIVTDRPDLALAALR
ncbi:glycerophosphodiester phosphodiesterase family protein [Leucobacter sp. GX24907]